MHTCIQVCIRSGLCEELGIPQCISPQPQRQQQQQQQQKVCTSKNGHPSTVGSTEVLQSVPAYLLVLTNSLAESLTPAVKKKVQPGTHEHKLLLFPASSLEPHLVSHHGGSTVTSDKRTCCGRLNSISDEQNGRAWNAEALHTDVTWTIRSSIT